MKQRLSSSWTAGYRLIFPGLLTVTAIALIGRYVTLGREPQTPDLLITVAAVVACMLLARILDRAKWVWITDNEIVVSDNRQEICLPIAEIKSVSVTPYFKPDRIKVCFLRPTLFGDCIVFFPPTGFFTPARKNPAFALLTSRLPAPHNATAEKA